MLLMTSLNAGAECGWEIGMVVLGDGARSGSWVIELEGGALFGGVEFLRLIGESKSFSATDLEFDANGLAFRMRGSRTGVRWPVEKGRLIGDGGMVEY